MALVLGAQKMDKKWVIELDEELKRLEDETLTMKRSIYKVPARVTDQNKEAYQPQVVSFGPYHHGEERLMPMEEHKRRALFQFLKRSHLPLQIIVENLTNVVQDLKDSYDLLDDIWQLDTERFLRLMILDGCFMLEVLHYDDTFGHGFYARNDPIFSTHGRIHVMPHIKRDMFLLENQLPMLVLIKLAKAMDHIYTEERYAQEFINERISMFTEIILPDIGECLHLLDEIRNGMFGSSLKGRLTTMCFYDPGQLTMSAMDIQEAGICFKKIKFGTPDEISFKDGVLSLPVLVIDDRTESMILNLIAFERLHVEAGNAVTSYIFFMGEIINSVRDVIILNTIRSEEAIVELFKSLSKGTNLDPYSSLSMVRMEIGDYRRRPRIHFRASFVHAYHVSTQWSPLAHWHIIFAILLFTLSLVQTVYTISPYYSPNK